MLFSFTASMKGKIKMSILFFDKVFGLRFRYLRYAYSSLKERNTTNFSCNIKALYFVEVMPFLCN